LACHQYAVKNNPSFIINIGAKRNVVDRNMILKKERGFRRGAGRGGAASGEYIGVMD
jgi:hypothetical protein